MTRAGLSAAASVRQVVNLLNLSTPLGLALSVLGGSSRSGAPDGLVVADRTRLPISAAAITIGNVILMSGAKDQLLERYPRLLQHEGGHATQWALLGPLLLPLYGLACLYSLARTGDRSSGNVFERWAGLEDGGYQRAAGRPRTTERMA